jgi:fructosamine-3-kinase
LANYEFTTLPDGTRVFRKFLDTGGSDRLAAEALGLQALADTGCVQTPTVLRVSDIELVTERVETGQPAPESWRTLGSQLAALQSLPQPCFGFTADNYCGETVQPNPRTDDGYAFFADHRLRYQTRLAVDAGLLDRETAARVEQLATRLETLIPEQPPALLHGDLWQGNVLFDSQGVPVVIDPACYWGWPEAEIAMCALFGGFPVDFYHSWEAAARPEPHWQERLPLYQLYHLLNHLNLFGPGYRPQIMAILHRFC